MIRGLIQKSIFETRWTTLWIAAGLFAFEWLIAILLPAFSQNFSQLLEQISFLQRLVSALLGTPVDAEIGPAVMATIPWMHPFVLLLTWALAIWFATRVPAGETDRGTIELVLALPVSRPAWMVSEGVVFLGAVMVVMIAGMGGQSVARLSTTEGEVSVSLATRIWLVLNLAALTIAVGGIAFLVSSLCERRGRAIGASCGIVAAFFILNSLAPFHEGIRRLSDFGLMHYYRPLALLQGDSVPLGDLVTLLIVGAILWTLAVAAFTRRDIRA